MIRNLRKHVKIQIQKILCNFLLQKQKGLFFNIYQQCFQLKSLELSSSNVKDNLSLKNLGSLRDKIKLFAQSVFNDKDPKDKTHGAGTTNFKTKRKNRATTTTNKKKDQRDQIMQDIFKSNRAIRMQSIYNLENSLGYRNQTSYILPNDMSLTYLLQNPLMNPGDVLNEIQSLGNSNQSSQKMKDVMQLDFVPQNNNKVFDDIQIILNSDNSGQSLQKLSSFPSDIQLQIVDNQWESLSQNSNSNKNQSIRQEVLQEIMDNGFIDQPVDEDTAQTNLEEFERQQRLDLLRFQKQSTKKIQQELQNTNENFFMQLQNSTLKDRKIYKIRNTLSHQKTDIENNKPEFDEISSVTSNQNIRRKRGQKVRKNQNFNQNEKIKIILDTSIDQKINLSLNSSQEFLNNSEPDSQQKQIPQKSTSNLNSNYLQSTKKNKFVTQDSFLQQLEINNLQSFKQFDNLQQYHSSYPVFNEIQFKSSNLQSSDLLTSQKNHPIAQLDLIQHALNELDQNSNNLYQSHNLQNQRQYHLFRTDQKKPDHSISSSFSYPLQSSEYSSQIAAVMHGENQFTEQQYFMDEFHQYPFNQKFSTQKKDHDSSSNHSKQDQTSQKSKSLQNAQLNQFMNVQPIVNLSFNQVQSNESKRNQISHINEYNNVLDPIIEGQTSLMILQGMHDKSSMQYEGILQSPLQIQDSLLEISSTNTNFEPKESFLQLSKDANKLLQMIAQQMKQKKLKKLELEKNFSGNQQVKSFLFYNLLSLKAADKIELIQKESINFSPIEISLNDNQV